MQNAAISTLLPVYNRIDSDFERGRAAELWTAEGRRYLDFGAGIAVVGLGHCHPAVTQALTDQAQQVWHVSNRYRIGKLERLADRLVANSFAETVFACNSGAEALEACIKMARRWAFAAGDTERNRIVTFEGSFHGRTMATISAAADPRLTDGFAPLLDGFDRIPFGDHDALDAAVTDKTCAVLIEPIQGEGGIRPVPPQCLKGLRELCDERGALLIFDEVQCGIGRTGKLFAYEWADVQPDIMALAKGLGNGFPIGACLATARAASGMTRGTHGSTFGGNPLASAVGEAVLDVMLEDGFLSTVHARGEHLRAALNDVAARYPGVFNQVRGLGLMLGMQLHVDNLAFSDGCHRRGLLTVPAADGVVRLLPPLIVTDADIDEAVGIIADVAADMAP